MLKNLNANFKIIQCLIRFVFTNDYLFIYHYLQGSLKLAISLIMIEIYKQRVWCNNFRIGAALTRHFCSGSQISKRSKFIIQKNCIIAS